jgi:hypothetical protein
VRAGVWIGTEAIGFGDAVASGVRGPAGGAVGDVPQAAATAATKSTKPATRDPERVPNPRAADAAERDIGRS